MESLDDFEEKVPWATGIVDGFDPDVARRSHDFSLRFPTPYLNVVQRNADAVGLDIAWAYGLIRQESRFIMIKALKDSMVFPNEYRSHFVKSPTIDRPFSSTFECSVSFIIIESIIIASEYVRTKCDREFRV